MTFKPPGQHVGSNEIMHRSRSGVAPLIARSEKIRNHDAQTGLGQGGR
jgi:hypothetical protein